MKHAYIGSHTINLAHLYYPHPNPNKLFHFRIFINFLEPIIRVKVVYYEQMAKKKFRVTIGAVAAVSWPATPRAWAKQSSVAACSGAGSLGRSRVSASRVSAAGGTLPCKTCHMGKYNEVYKLT